MSFGKKVLHGIRTPRFHALFQPLNIVVHKF